MTPELLKRAEEIFHQVLEAEPAERADRLREACAGDDALQEEVSSLLVSYHAAEAAPPVAWSEPELRPIQRIGPYTVERRLGEGGMGAVYLAHRSDRQYEKNVAIKLVRSGADTEALIHRFFTERQILAGMEHPNIARLLDGGLTESGQPYLVMDYIEGTRLDRYCDEHRLSIRERLELLVKICAGVNHAHQNLVVHRDLKPGNILVTAEGEPKLLDFGIAKVLEPSATAVDHTVNTSLFLTPLYASPELLRGHRTTVASDVYSLGVILYELLCGRRPYDSITFGPVDLIQAVITTDPQRPSNVGAKQAVRDSPEEVAGARRETPESLRRTLRGDLDSIVLKAIAKDLPSRYQSVEQLSADIRRYLEGRPVHAVQGNTLYRARKLVRRHRLAAASITMVAVSLFAGMAGTLWQAHIARSERANADRRFDDAHRLTNYLLFELYDSVQKLPGSTALQAEMARRSLDYFDRLSAARSSDRTLQTELAEGYLRLGDVLGNPFAPNLGDTKRAVESYRKAMTLAEPLAKAADTRPRLALARIYQRLGGSLVFSGKADEGLMLTEKAAGLFEKLVAANPADVDLRLGAGDSYQFLGRNLSQRSGWISMQDGDRVLANLKRGIDHLEAATRLDPRNPRALRLLALSYQTIGSIVATKDTHESLLILRKALGYLDRLPTAEETATRRQRASLLLNIGWVEGQEGEYKRAAATLEEGRDILVALYAEDPKNMAASYHRAIAYRSLGIVYAYAGRDRAALENFQRAVEVYNELIAKDPANASYPLFRAELQARLGNLFYRAGRTEEARRTAQAGITYLAQVADRPGASSSQLQDAARYLLETEVESLRDYPRALHFAERANQAAKGEDAAVLQYLAEAYYRNGNAAAAVETIRKALSQMPAVKAGEKSSRSRSDCEAALSRYMGSKRPSPPPSK